MLTPLPRTLRFTALRFTALPLTALRVLWMTVWYLTAAAAPSWGQESASAERTKAEREVNAAEVSAPPHLGAEGLFPLRGCLSMVNRSLVSFGSSRRDDTNDSYRGAPSIGLRAETYLSPSWTLGVGLSTFGWAQQQDSVDNSRWRVSTHELSLLSRWIPKTYDVGGRLAPFMSLEVGSVFSGSVQGREAFMLVGEPESNFVTAPATIRSKRQLEGGWAGSLSAGLSYFPFPRLGLFLEGGVDARRIELNRTPAFQSELVTLSTVERLSTTRGFIGLGASLLL